MARIESDESLYKLKTLHLGFQLGCIKDFEEVAKRLRLNVTSWYILSDKFQKDFFDGCACGNEVYNMSSKRARRVWDLHKDFFNQFDVIITSDTAPLSRIFLDNGWEKPLIIWVCNRFDYCHGVPKSTFPDVAYYELMKNARKRSNVFVIPYTDLEWVYAQGKGVDLGRRTIRPIGAVEDVMRDGTQDTLIPEYVNKQETIFLYPRFDHASQVDFIRDACNSLGVKLYHGAYNGPKDLEDFKGILYIPYAWSNVALFENIQRGIIHFVPTANFLKKLYREGKPIRSLTAGIILNEYKLCDWYNEEFADLFIYFDSWEELKEKIEKLDYKVFSKYVRSRGEDIASKTMTQWKQLFKEIVQCF